MGKVIDLTEFEERPEILTSTALTGGLLGGGTMLSTAPLETYLEDQESPVYAARNTKAGLEIERPAGTDCIEPGDDHQALALLTDLRVLFVVGQAAGDHRVEIPLDRIVEVKSEFEDFRTSELKIHTIADECWLFQCTDDTEPFAEAADELAQLWTHAQRLLDEAEMQVSSAEDALSESAIDRARDELGDAEGKIGRARDRIAEVGPAAADKVYRRAASLSRRLVTLERKLTAAEGARAHNRAQTAWEQREYEAAATGYERAIDSYERALSTDGLEPTQDALERRLRGAVKERELLRVGPLVDADTDRRRAIAREDPEEAAVWWVRALDGYRELLSLDWAKETRAFVHDREDIREETVEIADEAIGTHIRAGQQWIHAADRLARTGHEEQADRVYERAREQFEEAEEIASEVRPVKLDEIQSKQELVETRLSEGTPDEPVRSSASQTVEITGFHVDPDDGLVTDTNETQPATEDTVASRQPQQSEGVAENQTDGVTTPDRQEETAREHPPADSGQTHSERTDAPTDQQTGKEPSMLEQMQSAPAEDGDSPSPEATEAADDSESTERPNSHTDDQSGTLTDQLVSLTDDQFDAVVDDLWESQGWTTMSLSVQSRSAFDVLAMRDQPEEERLGIWTLHDPDGHVDTEELATCKDALEASNGADAATIVTTATVTPEAESALTDEPITVVETTELCQLLRFEALADEVRSLA
ncbi:Restriction endonuclease [Halovenus aranensis]|uniref:Restriction endonuclease n=1 Tax=Halovenus aranensis TaxID=890420 RepID=A0A1G8VF60_9EURY|nr:restriction endonuclease [Halovenus aranensis]SDJ64547.1 Restriction endonuclease [Halovenus aranensis]